MVRLPFRAIFSQFFLSLHFLHFQQFCFLLIFNCFHFTVPTAIELAIGLLVSFIQFQRESYQRLIIGTIHNRKREKKCGFFLTLLSLARDPERERQLSGYFVQIMSMNE
jgi:hypothetical protein